MISVNSSNLNSVGYDEQNNILRISFRSGKMYDYYNVPKQVYVGLMNADSVGRYHAANIVGRYKFSGI